MVAKIKRETVGARDILECSIFSFKTIYLTRLTFFEVNERSARQHESQRLSTYAKYPVTVEVDIINH